MKEEVNMLHELLDKIDSGELDLKDDEWFVVYPTNQHKEEDKRWFIPGIELKGQAKLRKELDRRWMEILWKR